MAPRKKAAEKASVSKDETSGTTETTELPVTGTEGTEPTTVDSTPGTDTTDSTTGDEGTEEPAPLVSEADELMVCLSNNSISGHELLRGNGEVVAIVGHGKVTFPTTKEELVAIETQLASKPWVEVHLVDDEAE